MIQFQHTGKSSFEQRVSAEKWFREYLGEFENEAESKNAFVTFYHEQPINTPKWFSFVINSEDHYEHGDFLKRFNEYKENL